MQRYKRSLESLQAQALVNTNADLCRYMSHAFHIAIAPAGFLQVTERRLDRLRTVKSRLAHLTSKVETVRAIMW